VLLGHVGGVVVVVVVLGPATRVVGGRPASVWTWTFGFLERGGAAVFFRAGR